MNLAEAIHPQLPARIAIVGGGGKTSALFQLVRQLPGPVWATTTTHLGTDQLDFSDQHFIVRQVEEDEIKQWLKQKVTLLTGEFTPDDRIRGPEVKVLEKIHQAAVIRAVSLVVEADGSRSRPLKTPGANEPATPDWAEMVITVAGLSALGQPFSEVTVHRMEPFSQITGLQVGQTITFESIIQLLADPQGGLKNCPKGATRVALLNQADTPVLSEQAAAKAPELLAGGYDQVVISSLKFAPDELRCFSK